MRGPLAESYARPGKPRRSFLNYVHGEPCLSSQHTHTALSTSKPAMFKRRALLLAFGLLAGGAIALQDPCSGLRLLFKASPDVRRACPAGKMIFGWHGTATTTDAATQPPP